MQLVERRFLVCRRQVWLDSIGELEFLKTFQDKDASEPAWKKRKALLALETDLQLK